MTRAIGAAAAVIKNQSEIPRITTERLSRFREVTDDRAALSAIIKGQKETLTNFNIYKNAPSNNVTILSDSGYAIKCMNEGQLGKWLANDWKTKKGKSIANSDLLEEAFYLDEAIKDIASVTYEKISSAENEEALEAVNHILDVLDFEEAMDEMDEVEDFHDSEDM